MPQSPTAVGYSEFNYLKAPTYRQAGRPPTQDWVVHIISKTTSSHSPVSDPFTDSVSQVRYPAEPSLIANIIERR